MRDFLTGGLAEIPAGWYASVVDFADLCLRIDSKVARKIRAAILKDAALWPYVPAALRSRLLPDHHPVGDRPPQPAAKSVAAF